jgi:hypothetical protein
MAIILVTLIALFAAGLFVTLVCLWRRLRRTREEASRWARIAEYGNETNYRLACELYGKEAVDLQIREDAAKGTN